MSPGEVLDKKKYMPAADGWNISTWELGCSSGMNGVAM